MKKILLSIFVLTACAPDDGEIFAPRILPTDATPEEAALRFCRNDRGGIPRWNVEEGRTDYMSFAEAWSMTEMRRMLPTIYDEQALRALFEEEARYFASQRCEVESVRAVGGHYAVTVADKVGGELRNRQELLIRKSGAGYRAMTDYGLRHYEKTEKVYYTKRAEYFYYRHDAAGVLGALSRGCSGEKCAEMRAWAEEKREAFEGRAEKIALIPGGNVAILRIVDGGEGRYTGLWFRSESGSCIRYCRGMSSLDAKSALVSTDNPIVCRMSECVDGKGGDVDAEVSFERSTWQVIDWTKE